MNELALFAGGGGGILGGLLLGWRTVCAVELDPYARSILLARQKDQILGPFPIWDDVCTFDGAPWRGSVDVVSGGFPCQGVSAANPTGKGLADPRSGLWSQMARVISEVRPAWVFVENSPLLISRGMDRVLSDLASMGYHAAWGVIGAHHMGAPHKRDRIWIVAHAESERINGINGGDRGGALARCQAEPKSNGGRKGVAHSNGKRQSQPERHHQEKRRRPLDGREELDAAAGGGWWLSEPGVGRLAHGVADRMGKLRALGNGQVPAVAAFAFRYLQARLIESSRPH